LELQADSSKDISEWLSALQLTTQLEQDGITSNTTGILNITIIEAELIINTEMPNLKVFCEMGLLGQKITTTPVPYTDRLISWNQDFEISLTEEALTSELVVSLKYRPKEMEQDISIGEVRIPISLMQYTNQVQCHKLTCKKNFTGSLKLGLRIQSSTEELDEAQLQLWSLSQELLEVDDLIFGTTPEEKVPSLCQDP